MYPDYAFYEFYPEEIVERVLREHPDATVRQLNCLMQEEWDIEKSRLADEPEP